MAEPLSKAEREKILRVAAIHRHHSTAHAKCAENDERWNTTVQRAEAVLREIADMDRHQLRREAWEVLDRARAYFEETRQ